MPLAVARTDSDPAFCPDPFCPDDQFCPEAPYAEYPYPGAAPTVPAEADVSDPAHDASPDWVEAAPFRAKLRLLMAETGLPWQVIAVAAWIPQSQARALLYGRGGRALRRLYAPFAQRLFVLDAASLAEAGQTLTPRRGLLSGERVSRRIRRLREAGVPVAELARQLDLPMSEVRRLGVEPVRVSHLTWLRAEAAFAEHLNGLAQSQYLRGRAEWQSTRVTGDETRAA